MSLGFDRPYPSDPKRYRVDQDEYVTGSLVLQSGATMAIMNPAVYNNAPVGGKFLQLGSDNTIGCSAGGAGSGSVTSITAGTGLSGGTITGAGTISTNLTAGANVTITAGTGTELVIAATGGGGGGSITTVAAGNGITVAGGTGPTATVTNNITAGSGISITGTNPLTIAATGGGSGTVTSITAGRGISLTPSTITTTGSIKNIGLPVDQIADPQIADTTLTGLGTHASPFVSTDGTGGLQACITALTANGGTVWLTPSEYTITTGITIPDGLNAIQLAGTGPHFGGSPAAIGESFLGLKLRPGPSFSTGSIITLNTGSNHIGHAVFQGLGFFDPNGTVAAKTVAANAVGFHVTGYADQCHWSGNTFIGLGIAIFNTGALRMDTCVIEKCTFDGNAASFVSTAISEGTRIVNNVFADATDLAIRITTGFYNVIQNNFIYNQVTAASAYANPAAIQLFNSNDDLIEGNYFATMTTTPCIILDNTLRQKIVNNSFNLSAGGPSIQIGFSNPCFLTTIANNIFGQCGITGATHGVIEIKANGSTAIVISNNLFDGGGVNNTAVYGTATSTNQIAITGNIVQDEVHAFWLSAGVTAGGLSITNNICRCTATNVSAIEVDGGVDGIISTNTIWNSGVVGAGVIISATTGFVVESNNITNCAVGITVSGSGDNNSIGANSYTTNTVDLLISAGSTNTMVQLVPNMKITDNGTGTIFIGALGMSTTGLLSAGLANKAVITGTGTGRVFL